REARDVLSRLVAVYEQRGQLHQAARIKGMLGAPKTGPLTEDLPPRPDVIGTTGNVEGRTAPLRNPTAAIGKAKEAAKSAASASPDLMAFPPESLMFTIPLPGTRNLSPEAKEIL